MNFHESLSDDDVEIADDVFILRAKDAQVKWSAAGDEVRAEGLDTLDEDSTGGLRTVRADSGGQEAVAEIRVIAPKDSGSEPKLQKTAIHWAGEIPPQKWMNFYMKVVSRFASREGLKLKVTLEVPAEGDQGQTDAEDARSGLKELGLNDDVRLG